MGVSDFSVGRLGILVSHRAIRDFFAHGMDDLQFEDGLTDHASGDVVLKLGLFSSHV